MKFFYEVEMENFIDYLLKEYNLPSEVVCNKVIYSHSTKNKIDKKSNVPITNNIITVKIESFDKNHQKLASNSERFIDGQIERSKTKKLINIAPAELNNKFAAAKSQICSVINSTYNERLNELKDSIHELSEYCGSEIGVIPEVFINEAKITKETKPEKPKTKFEF